ncbi:MAG: tRNA (adenosine(37)-N6)-threonylcarbamoyltransferase complex ATPase subunit type 1 TsaE [Rickettsia sp.]|nr:tRNA (adenosine(37)-N6)-threonylcarbamoyltransferase complex ATPase subunit type 1 TsaE [Rickettsia sp.]
MDKNFLIKNFDDSINIVNFLSKFTKDFKIITLEGTIGSGKSFLCYHISKILLKTNNFNFSSPSFSLVNIYNNEDYIIYHLDLYRIKTLDQIYNLGFEEILDQANLVLIEWPELILKMLSTHKFIKLKIDLLDTNLRKCYIKFVSVQN